jgi:hypothetical protein
MFSRRKRRIGRIQQAQIQLRLAELRQHAYMVPG